MITGKFTEIIFRVVIKYITPTFLLVILITWTVQQAVPSIMMDGIAPENRIWVLGTRLFIFAVIIVLIVLVNLAWRGRSLPDIDSEIDHDIV